MEYGIYEIENDKFGHEMIDNYKRFRIKLELAPDEDMKKFYQKILADLNEEFIRRFNFNWEEDGL